MLAALFVEEAGPLLIILALGPGLSGTTCQTLATH